MVRLDKQLSDLERQHHLSCRWNPSDMEYLEAQRALSREKSNQVAEALWTTSSRRQFLLKLKAKYAGKELHAIVSTLTSSVYHLIPVDGQKIAKKLSVQISKETKKIESLLPEYNACQVVIGGDSAPLLLLEEALDPSLLAAVLKPNSSLPFDSKRELIDAYIMMKRSSEEISMLDTEMENTTQYYLDRKNTLQKLLESFSQRGDAFGRGAVALLQDVYLKVDRKITERTELFAVTDSRSPFFN